MHSTCSFELLPCMHVQGIKFVRCCCRCPQKTGIFQDLQVQASHERHKIVKINEIKKLRICARACFSPSMSVTNHDFYTPCLYATPTEATQLYIMTGALMTAHAQALYR